MKFLTLFMLYASVFRGAAPEDSVSLQYCYEKAAENYPVARNIELQKRITQLNVEIANTGYLPDININGRASYQSEVTEFPVSNAQDFPGVSKDQYEASLNVTQNIFNGGAVGIRKELERAVGEQEIHNTEVELHQIRSQVNQVYFGILLSRQQNQVNDLLIEDLQKRLGNIQSQVRNGVLLPSQQYILEAELIKARQDSVNIQSNIRAYYQVLSEIIGEEIDPSTPLILPETRIDYQSLHPQRPEYDLFSSTQKTLEQQKRLAETNKLPSVSAFGTAAYGRPGLNFLNDDFHEYYIVGIRLRWNLFDFLNADREMQVLKIQQQKVMQNREAFTRQLKASLDRISEKIASLQENIERDKEIIELRNRVVKESASQLENGIITATEYITELNQANKAQLSLFMNRVRLAEARMEYATALGVPIE